MSKQFRFIRFFGIVAILAGAFLFALPRNAFAAPQSGGTFYVNSTADDTNKDSLVTLREAMLVARDGTNAAGLNRHISTAEKNLLTGCQYIYHPATDDWTIESTCGGGNDTIDFLLSGCPCSIEPTSALPVLQDDSIDGYSQSGSSVNTSKKGTNAQIMVRLIGVLAGANVDGLDIIGYGSTVKGLEIYGFGGFGLNIDGGYVHILGNLIDDNVKDGIVLTGGTNSIGDDTLAGRNGIYANGWHGVELFNGADNNTIQGNLIGVAPDGSAFYGNLYSGLSIYSSINAIEHNTIAFNHNNGILILSGVQNLFHNNSIYNNSQLGIDLGNDGVTKNDSKTLDTDTGANTLQNYPVLQAAVHATKTVQGKLVSTPNTTFQVDVYAGPTCDIQKYGQGKKYLGNFNVTTNGTGTAKFTAKLKNFGVGNAITAIASSGAGTSEFSKCVIAK